VEQFFCPLPWIHQFIQIDGIKMCCVSNTSLNLKPDEFKNSEFIKDVKDTIAGGRIPHDCQSCVKMESRGLKSVREGILNDFNYTIETVPDRIEYLDLRHSNLCNFSCRTCSPTYSSSINREVINNEKLLDYYIPVETGLKYDIASSIDPLIPNLSRLNLTGGEPLIIKENLDILQRLLDQGRNDVHLLITTNASTFNPKILKLITQFSNVHWTISIDGINEIGEYARHGTDWTTVNANVHQILQLKHSVSVNVTISAYSVLGLGDTCRWFENLRNVYKSQPLEIMFGIATNIDAKFLPNHLRKYAKENLEQAIFVISKITTNPDSELDTLKSLRNELDDVTIHRATAKFIQFTRDLDASRNQSFESTFNLPLEI
jgi:sulfatase maturation enzyme AslB (radical SAM superfamily)